ncbi:MAG: RIP metalloprotease RseP [Prevotellaceae bacterium]|nr:RIP metalloprotease RseP [Candidatus Colivivens equi]
MVEVLIQILQLIAAFALLIALHEGGHFLAAKLFKVRVEKFYLFFDAWNISLFSTYKNWFRKLRGKEPAKKKFIKDKNGNDVQDGYEYEGTEYGIGWLPLGGYVKISGMIDESMDLEQMKQDPQPWEFRTKPAWQRLIIMLGGVIMNFITAFVLYSLVLCVWGESYIEPKDMTYGFKFSETAKQDGFQDGDIILKIDNKPLKKWNTSCIRNISNAKSVTVLRNGQESTVSLSGKMNMLDMLDPIYAQELMPLEVDSILHGSPAEKIGLKHGDHITAINGKEVKDFNDFTTQLATIPASLGEDAIAADSLKARHIVLTINGEDKDVVLTETFKLGFQNKVPNYKITTKTYNLISCIPAGIDLGCEQISGYVNDLKYIFTAKGAKSVGGPVGIVSIFPKAWDWLKFWMLTAFLSIALGVMNLLPIPALDGGHAVIAIWEIITRKKPNDKFLERVQTVGLWLIIALMVLATWNDIMRLLNINL